MLTVTPTGNRPGLAPSVDSASLLASISLGYPAGTLMMLRAGSDVASGCAPVEGAMPLVGVQPERLILDGRALASSALGVSAPYRSL